MPKLDHLTIAVSDWMASRDWYVAHLGFTVEFDAPEGGAALQDEAGLTLFLEQFAEPIRSGQGSYMVQVDDVEALYDRLSGSGLAFVAPPGKQFWGYGAVLGGPDGHMLHLYDAASMNEKVGLHFPV
jgi:catechol 2,3-dioxygenase-like lactoylglutathione lyase family enzyme